ncbi:MAG: hypothetical protein ABIY70_05000 [Capsulimonas sp.]|uniref:hypothetical protein n=1 Tax=Capsulimonas sp. TaxID=2494211 RepID=UPI0032657D62
MIIWGALLIPLIGAAVLYRQFRRRMTWWEFFVPLMVSVAVIAVGKGVTQAVQTHDTEYWGGYITEAAYEEPWDKEVSCTHKVYRTERYACGDRQTSKTCTRQVFDHYAHSYDVEAHSAKWYAKDSIGQSWDLSKSEFENFSARWGHRAFVDMHRSYHSIDGDKYVTTWDGQYSTLQPTTRSHSYENRVQASTSVFNPPSVSDQTKTRLGLFDYPDNTDGLHCPAVLPTGKYEGEEKLQKMNAMLGASKKFRLWVLVFKNRPRESGRMQDNYWKHGNENELCICIGVNDANEVQWCEVFSWTKVEDVKVQTRDFVIRQRQLNLNELGDFLKPLITNEWKKRSFREFSYLTVEPPLWTVLLGYLLVIGATVGCCWWVVKNRFTPNGSERPSQFQQKRSRN